MDNVLKVNQFYI